MYQINQLKTASSLISLYKGNEPLHIFLKKYFSENKKHGSTDRKNISSFCYAYYRLGKADINDNIEDRILTSLFLSTTVYRKLLTEIKPEWASVLNDSLDKKISVAKIEKLSKSIFPFCDMLSEGIDCEKCNYSFLEQPDVFSRIRPGFKTIVLQKLDAAKVSYELIAENTLKFSPNTKIDNILEVDKEVVIQDINSQKISSFMEPLSGSSDAAPFEVWDACAASGGKSLMAFDMNNSITLNVSDIRENILQNLNMRFQRAGIKNYNSFIIDLADDKNSTRSLKNGSVQKMFDFVIADVPCTGSGTWARTPENLFYFNPKQILKYHALQRAIIKKTIEHIKPGGYFLYITCSVFYNENESQVDFILKNSNLKLVRSEMLKGYDQKSDSLFGALFKA